MIYKHFEGAPNGNAFRELVDIKGEGSYIVLAPSIVHGKPYEWNEPWQDALDSLEPFPVLEKVVPQNHAPSQKLDYKSLISLGHGSRNERMHRLVCSLYAKGHSDEEVALLANAVNETYDPPIGKMRGDSPYELQNIINSARSFIGKSKGVKSSERQDFKLVSWGEFNAREFPENPWRVEKLVPEFGITILAAPSGGRKSWVILDMIRAIASGESFLGTFQTKKGAVLYIEQETPEQEVQRRGRQLRFPEMGMEGVFITSSSGEPLNLNSNENVRKLTEEVSAQKISVVVIDTLRSVAGGLKEEKAEEVRAFFNRFKPMAESGVSVIFLDHTRKPRQFENRSKPAMDQILGSQDKIASVANVLMLGPGSEGDTITLHQMKLKGGREEKPFVIKMRDEDDGVSGKKTYLEHGGGFDEEEFKIEQAKSLIIEYLDEQKSEKKAQEIIEALTTKVGKTNVEKALKQMREAESVKFVRDGRAFVYWTETESQDESWGDFDASP